MIQIKGGNGSSKERAVIIIAPNEKSGIDAEYKHLESIYGQRNVEWILYKQTLIVEENKYYDVLVIELRNTELHF